MAQAVWYVLKFAAGALACLVCAMLAEGVELRKTFPSVILEYPYYSSGPSKQVSHRHRSHQNLSPEKESNVMLGLGGLESLREAQEWLP